MEIIFEELPFSVDDLIKETYKSFLEYKERGEAFDYFENGDPYEDDEYENLENLFLDDFGRKVGNDRLLIY